MDSTTQRTPCPKCSTSMESLSLAGVVIDSCPFCNGCWLDGKELERITRSRGSDAVQVELRDAKASDLRCPRCAGSTLQVGEHSRKAGLIIDQCPRCAGVWLDRGELPQLLARN